MMNRIILVGNGFDLAHGLPTSYKDFINDYWANWIDTLSKEVNYTHSDELTTLSCNNQRYMWCQVISSWRDDKREVEQPSNMELFQKIKADSNLYKIDKSKSPLFQSIDDAVETKNWVDIENEYYQFLKRIIKDDNKPYPTPQKLDEDFGIIKSKLEGYLTKIQKEHIIESLEKPAIREAIYEPINVRDISNESMELFLQFLEKRWIIDSTQTQNKFKTKYGNKNTDDSKNNRFIKADEFDAYIDKNKIKKIKGSIPGYYLLPDDILFLNFNYTRTANLYAPDIFNFKVTHIHGELGNDKNPIIFGYGDEMDEDYKTISNLNDNGYLTNIKSIHYLETDNYRKLLRFIDSAPFQIYIMGHSCGNSDRTLLNTLFEHKNCVSIKPFYHETKDGHDNYIEIIQNISRNFNDMRLMRDRVVNKAYCRPLVQP